MNTKLGRGVPLCPEVSGPGRAGSSPLLMTTVFTGYVLMRQLCTKCFIVIIFQSLGKASGQVLFYPLSTDERKLGLSL